MLKIDKSLTLTIPPEAHGQRLDKWLSAVLPEHSRSQLQRLIGEGRVTLNDAVHTNSSLKLSAEHQSLTLTIPEPVEMDLAPIPMDLEILFEDEHLIVLNKPSGLTVHPAPGEKNATLVHGLLDHCGDSLSGIGGVQRPGIVHRLDKDTSGAMVVAKTDQAHKHLAAQLKDRSLSRTYHAICYRVPKLPKGTVDAPIGRSNKDRKKMAVVSPEKGKAARTHYRVVETLAEGALSLIECKLESGRTHQIRVHLSHIGHPLVGDGTYGRKRTLANKEYEAILKTIGEGQLLHAKEIGFVHPKTSKEIKCEAEYPEEFKEILNALSG